MKIWRMSIACWIPKAKNVNTGCVTIINFPLPQLMYESSSMSLLTCSASLVTKHTFFGLGIN